MTPNELVARRKALGLSQALLGRVLGVPRNTIARWERGDLRIARSEWLELALSQLETDHTSTSHESEEVARAPHAAFRRVANLPQELSSFIGREDAIAACLGLIATHRLVTLTGAGGIGKSRLALRVASAVQHEFRDGVCLVELASLPDPTLLPRAVATALSMRERPGQTMLETLVSALRTSQLLVVLDNCEHLIHACAELADALLRAGPDLRILVTSREPLNAIGEAAWRVPSLRLPEHAATTDESAQSEAVRLFVERARAAVPGFELGPANVETLTQVVHRLDGIPLAIELAAARLRAMSLDQLADRLDDRFRLLVGGNRNALARHQTLRATIEWSYDLLDAEERRLFDRLAVFAGGWTLDAAEAVCSDADLPSHAVLGLLERLIDKSLVVYEPLHAAARYAFLETLRDFAAERLALHADLPVLRRRHFDWVLGVARNLQLSNLSADDVAALEREEDNVRASLRDAIERQDADAGLTLAVATAPLWNLRGHYAEGRAWLEALLALPETTDLGGLRWRALKWDGVLAFGQGDLTAAELQVNAGWNLARTRGDPPEEPLFVEVLANIYSAHGRLEDALPLYITARERYRSMGLVYWEAGTLAYLASIMLDISDPEDARRAAEECLALGQGRDFGWASGRAMRHLARLAARDGQPTRARQLLERALAIHNSIGDAMGAIHTLRYQALIALDRGEHTLARASLLRALALAQDSGDQLSLARCLEGLAGVMHTDRPAEAARLLACADAMRLAAGAPAWPNEQVYLRRWRSAIRARIGGGAFESELEAGRELAPDLAAMLAREWVDAAVPIATADAPGLTARQTEVALLIARGQTNAQIAETLVISAATARAHIEHILDRLGLRSRAQIAAWAAANHLI